jgi:hypothetical protein
MDRTAEAAHEITTLLSHQSATLGERHPRTLKTAETLNALRRAAGPAHPDTTPEP